MPDSHYAGLYSAAGFVAADVIIDINGKRIAVKPGFIVGTDGKDKRDFPHTLNDYNII